MEERKILVARTAGFCFGVKRAVEKVYEQVNMGKQNIYTYGPIIHNEEVVTDLGKKGVRVLENERNLRSDRRKRAGMCGCHLSVCTEDP